MPPKGWRKDRGDARVAEPESVAGAVTTLTEPKGVPVGLWDYLTKKRPNHPYFRSVQGEVVDRLESAYKRVVSQRFKRDESVERTFEMILLPRNTLKTTTISHGFPEWALGQNPNLCILQVAEDKEAAEDNLDVVKRVMESDPDYEKWYGRMKPDVKYDELRHRWGKTQITVARRTELFHREPSVAVLGYRNVSAGPHHDFIIVDDIHARASHLTMEKAWKTLNDLVWMLAPWGAMIILMTRWDEYDVPRRLLTQWPTRFTNTPLIKPAESDNNIETYTFTGVVDPRTGTARTITVQCGDSNMPELWPKKILARMKAETDPYEWSCNPGEAPILMSDWTSKPISEVRAGNEVVGFKKVDGRYRLVKTLVEQTGSRIAHTVWLDLSNGRSIRCTPDHGWFTGEHSPTRREYREPAVKRWLGRVITEPIQEPTNQEKEDWRWLGGIIDGEGSCGWSTISVSQSEEKNPLVYAEILAVLDRLKIPYSVWRDERNSGRHMTIRGGRTSRAAILRFARPAKAPQILRTLFRESGRVCQDWDRIERIRLCGEEPVYSLRTETGNYVVWGYASKNCQMRLQPVAPHERRFDPDNFHEFEGTEAAIQDILHRSEFTGLVLDPTTISDGPGSDHALIAFSWLPGGHYYQLDCWSKRCGEDELFAKVADFLRKYRPGSFGIEKVGWTVYVENNLRRYLRELAQSSRGATLPTITPLFHGGKSKPERVKSWLSDYARDFCHFSDRMEHGAKFKELVFAFPGNEMSSIDLLDAWAYVYTLTGPRIPYPILTDQPEQARNTYQEFVDAVFDGTAKQKFPQLVEQKGARGWWTY